jgi:hypothetical protein
MRIKDCPYCYSKGFIYYDKNDNKYYISCFNSKCSVRSDNHKYIIDAVANWNTLNEDPLQNPKSMSTW